MLELTWAAHALGGNGTPEVRDEIHKSKIETLNIWKSGKAIEVRERFRRFNEEMEGNSASHSGALKMVRDKPCHPSHLLNRANFWDGDVRNKRACLTHNNFDVSRKVRRKGCVYTNSTLLERVIVRVKHRDTQRSKGLFLSDRSAVLKVEGDVHE
jgi:hypothetical protein